MLEVPTIGQHGMQLYEKKTTDFHILGAHKSFTICFGHFLLLHLSRFVGSLLSSTFLLLDLYLASRRQNNLLIMNMGFKITIVSWLLKVIAV